MVNSGSPTTYAYNAADELTTSQAGAGVTTYTFDGDGNLLTTLAPGNQLTTNTWDGENRLTVALADGRPGHFHVQWRRTTREEAEFNGHHEPRLGRSEHLAGDRRKQSHRCDYTP